MKLEISGITAKQAVLCDIMWTIVTQEGVESFISTLPTQDQRDCRSLIEMMKLAFIDEINSTDLAQEVLIKWTKS